MWICKIYEHNIFKSRILTTTIFFVIPWAIIFLPYFITRLSFISNYNMETIVSLMIAGCWAFLGPLFISGYYKVIKCFQKKIYPCKETMGDDACNGNVSVYRGISKVIESEIKRQTNRVKVICVLWISLVVTILLVFNKRLEYFAFFGFSDIYYWILLFFVSYLLYLQSIGFAGLLTSSKIIKTLIKNENLLKEMLKEPGKSIVELFGFLLIRTSLYFFSGIVFFPLLIVFSRTYNFILTFFMICLMIIFSLSILIFFISTYMSISSNVQNAKNSLVTERLKEINSFNESENTDVNKAILNELRIANLYREIEKIESINTNPVRMSKVVVIIFTVIFPVLFFLKDFVDLINRFFGIMSPTA